jgi:glycosyltransferase involved in cell wall biosynthesis
MRILHLIPSIALSDGGPIEALAGWCEGLVDLGVDVTIASVKATGKGPPIELCSKIRCIEDKECLPYVHYAYGLSSRLKSESFQLVHSHGLWTYPNYLADRLAFECQVPHVISCCGMLDPKALKRSSLRKKIAGIAFQKKALDRASMLIANSEQEHKHILQFIRHDRISLVSNPVRVRSKLQQKKYSYGDKDYVSLPSNIRVILFLGRLHPVKGIQRLLEAWSSLQNKHYNWHLVLAGPDQGNYQNAVSSYSVQFQSRTHLLGQVAHQEKWELLDRADLFVMPSDHENFGIAIAEALTAGVPVITTTGTPWRILQDIGAGWWVPCDVSSLIVALDAAMSEPDTVRIRRAQLSQFISREYEVNSVAHKLINVYEHCISRFPFD